MTERLFALFVCDRPHLLDGLTLALKDLSVETFGVRTIEEAARLMNQTQPIIVFTDIVLPDGTWKDVVNVANQSGARPDVVVVSPNKDLRLYLSTIEYGAFDFVVPPFEHQPLNFIVQSAATDVRIRRQSVSRSAAAAA